MTRAIEAAAWRLQVEDLGRRPAPGLDAPDQLRFTPDGGAVTFLYGPGAVRALWRIDLATGVRRLLAASRDSERTERGSVEPADRAEELRRERTRTYALGVTRYAWSGTPERPVLLVPVDGHWRVGHGSDPTCVPSAALDGAVEAALSPDGGRVAFARDGDVWLAGTDGDAQLRRLTDDAEPGVTNGLAEYIAAEELRRFDGMWWSCDGSQLAIARVDERRVEEVVIAHLRSSGQVERHRYPRAGTPNAEVRLRLVDVADGHLRDVALPMQPDDYLARVVPQPDGGFLVAILPRAQQELRWLTIGTDSRARPAWTETGGRWINLDEDTHVLDDGRILRTTERSGFRHLEIREPDGSVRRLTDGAWVVTRIAGVASDRSEAIVIGTRDGVTERHVYAVPLDGGHVRRLSHESGWHDAVLSPEGDRWIDSWSTRFHAPAVVLRDRSDGHLLRELHAPSTDAASVGLRPPELLELSAADGFTRLHGAYYPAEGGADRPPLVVSTYGGPHSQKVIEHWALTVDLAAQRLAQRGIAVLVVDNRGTFNRGIAFEAPLFRRLGVAEVQDTAAAVRELVRRGLADPRRIGIIGWSYGGYMVVRCMLAEPDLFAVGVAGAPVTDWRLYDSAYTERYLGDPAAEPDAYRASGLAPAAAPLRGRLLIIHGIIDENVHLRHTARLLASLGTHGTAPEVLLLPGERHGVRSAEALRHRSARTLQHLEAALRPGAG
ncbi:MAG: DPP IV N-terminal domain-containing protein [Chloroflexota bacterium]